MRTYNPDIEKKLISLGIDRKEQPFKVIKILLDLIPEQLSLFNIGSSPDENYRSKTKSKKSTSNKRS